MLQCRAKVIGASSASNWTLPSCVGIGLGNPAPRLIAGHQCVLEPRARHDSVMQIFHEAYIPRRLTEVEDYEGDFERLINAGTEEKLDGIYYQTIAGVYEAISVVHGIAYTSSIHWKNGHTVTFGLSARHEEGHDGRSSTAGCCGTGAICNCTTVK